MEIPNEIMNKIMRFNSHPVADLMKDIFRQPDIFGDYFDNEIEDGVSFANFYLQCYEIDIRGGGVNPKIYSYEFMDEHYIDTLNEYLESQGEKQIYNYSKECRNTEQFTLSDDED